MSVDQVLPESQWEFDAEVTRVFDNMLSRSIPSYQVMRQLVSDLAADYGSRLSSTPVVIDLGASRGEALAGVQQRLGRAGGLYHAIEVSEPMVDSMKERWPDDLFNAHRVNIHHADLRDGLPGEIERVDVALCVLTLQFIAIEHRQRILREVYECMRPGAVLLFVEKILGATADIDRTMVKHYYRMKSENGYSQEQIDTKRKSLEGVLVPLTATMNEELLLRTGFDQVDCFWRWCNFAGWVAYKP